MIGNVVQLEKLKWGGEQSISTKQRRSWRGDDTTHLNCSSQQESSE